MRDLWMRFVAPQARQQPLAYAAVMAVLVVVGVGIGWSVRGLGLSVNPGAFGVALPLGVWLSQRGAGPDRWLFWVAGVVAALALVVAPVL